MGAEDGKGPRTANQQRLVMDRFAAIAAVDVLRLITATDFAPVILLHTIWGCRRNLNRCLRHTKCGDRANHRRSCTQVLHITSRG